MTSPRLLVPAVALLLGCGGSAASAPRSPWGDGQGFGLGAAEAVRGAPEAGGLASANWDVAIDMAPGSATVSERPDGWSATNSDRASPQAGQFVFMVMRSESVATASPSQVATLLREDEESRGMNVTEVAETEFLGRPGAMYVSSGAEGTSVTVLTVSQNCVYVLNVTRAGGKDALASYFGGLVSMIRTYSGGPLDAPACR
jgi:hypothetical protein